VTQQDADATEVDEGEVVERMALVADDEPAADGPAGAALGHQPQHLLPRMLSGPMSALCG
jgi:hypothetical protein